MIKLLNGEQWEEADILKKMEDDSFYYGHLGKHALSSSSLKKLVDSPKAYYKSLFQDASGQALRDGRLIHLHALEPHRIAELHIVDGTKATKAFKDAVAEIGDHLVYTKSEVDNAFYIARALHDCSEAKELLDDCNYEMPGVKMVEGLAIRAKADGIKKNGKTIIDVKSTTDIAKFHWSAQNFSYDLQAALYMHIFGAAEFIFLVVDKDTKDVGIYDCSDAFIARGWAKVEAGLKGYKWFFQQNDPKESLKNYVIHGLL